MAIFVDPYISDTGENQFLANPMIADLNPYGGTPLTESLFEHHSPLTDFYGLNRVALEDDPKYLPFFVFKTKNRDIELESVEKDLEALGFKVESIQYGSHTEATYKIFNSTFKELRIIGYYLKHTEFPSWVDTGGLWRLTNKYILELSMLRVKILNIGKIREKESLDVKRSEINSEIESLQGVIDSLNRDVKEIERKMGDIDSVLNSPAPLLEHLPIEFACDNNYSMSSDKFFFWFKDSLPSHIMPHKFRELEIKPNNLCEMCYCVKDSVKYQINPFDDEVNNEINYQYLCEECYIECGMEI